MSDNYKYPNYEFEISDPDDIEELIVLIQKSLKIFIENDLLLIELHVDERAITHQIACYMKKFFPNWDVDCEYNRDGIKTKTLSRIGSIRPDIIIHHRKTSENFLIVEIKKDQEHSVRDEQKIKQFTSNKSNYSYLWGLYLNILSSNPPKFIGSLFKNGEKIREFEYPIPVSQS